MEFFNALRSVFSRKTRSALPGNVLRRVLVALMGLIALDVGQGFTAAHAAVTVRDYARAERFLSWNKDRYVLNADVQHHWIGNEDRFWYRRVNSSGEAEYVIVDAVTGERRPAFDQARIAEGLSEATGTPVSPGKLPFSYFRYARDDPGAIMFSADGKLWSCWEATEACVAVADAGATNEVLSPDGKWAASVRQHNLWVRPISGGREIPLTTDGNEHYSYAAVPGDSTHAVSDIVRHQRVSPQVLWSPDSRFLLSYRLDERKVLDMHLLQSVPDDGAARPKLFSYRYALPGDENLPTLQLVVFDVAAKKQVRVATKPLICTVLTPIQQQTVWWSHDSANVYYLDRDRFSRSLTLLKADPVTGTAKVSMEEAADLPTMSNANNVFDRPQVRVLSNGNIVWYSQRDGWGHLYLYKGSTGLLLNQVTRGNWVVRSLVRVDERAGRIYFMASGRERDRAPYEQYLYSIRFDGSGLRLLTPEPGEHESYENESTALDELPSIASSGKRFSTSGRYFVDSYSRSNTPPVFLVRTADGRMIKKLEEADASRLLAGGYMPVESFNTLGADGKTMIYGNLFRPSTFDPSRTYPVIDSIYGGPQARRTRWGFTATIFDRFEAQSLAELGFVVVTVDGRGTPNRSREFANHSYGRIDLASDLDDHVAAIRELGQRYRYMDLTRVGVDGDSAGGYAAAHAILAYPDFFKVAVAASGTHDQSSYVAPWAESYLGPASADVYRQSSTLPLAKNLKGKLLLMHGEMDDNVHPGSTMRLVNALIAADKNFDLMIIPNGDHFAGSSTYFIRRKWDYFVQNLLDEQAPTYSISRLP